MSVLVEFDLLVLQVYKTGMNLAHVFFSLPAVVGLLLVLHGTCVADDLPMPETFPLKGDTLGVHDPTLFKEGNSFYVFCTGGLLRIRQSSDLVHWESRGEVFDKLPEWIRGPVPRVHDLWAPEIHFLNGKYHLYYAASNFGVNNSVVGLATNTTLDTSSPLYRWEDQGMVLTSNSSCDFNAIDASAVKDAQGRWWLVWGSYWTGIKMRLMDEATGKLSEADPTTHSLAMRPENTAVEAPFIFRKNGYYYLFVSFDQCCTGIKSTYRMHVGRSKEITGPYVDRLDKPMLEGGGTPFLVSSGRWRGPGHGMVFSDAQQDFVCHHAYDAENDGKATLNIRPVFWTQEGWPLAGEIYDGRRGTTQKVPSAQLQGRWLHQVNGDTPVEIELAPGGRVVTEVGSATWELKQNQLIMRWKTDDGATHVDRCVVGPNASYYTGRNETDLLIRGVRKTAK